MKVKIQKHLVTLQADKGERYRNESALFYALKKALIAKGLDAIKKCPDKDGCMFSAPWYVRDRKNQWAIYDGNYALRMAHEDFNRDGKLELNRLSGKEFCD